MSDSQSEPLVLIPGLLCSPALFAPQVAALGRSRAVLVADHTRAANVQEIAAQIVAEAPAQFALAGLSMGGYIVFEILRQAPQRVTRAAFLDTSARPDTPDRTADRRRLMEIARTEGVRKVQGMLLPRLVHPDRLADKELCGIVLGMAETTGLEAFLREEEAIIARPDSRPGLTQIKCPTLVLVGEQDLQTPPEIAREMADAIPGSRLRIIADCGHLSTLEKPQAATAALEEWLQT